MADNARIEELRRRVQADPASIAFAALAEEYRRAGLYEEAIATCRAGLERHPAYLSAHVTLGRALIETTRFDEAREELEYVLKVAPENLAAIRGLAEIHHRRGELREEEHYKVALEAARRDAAVHESHAAPAHAATSHAATVQVAASPLAKAHAAVAVSTAPVAHAPATAPAAAPAATVAVAPASAPTPRISVQPVRVQQPAATPDPALAHLEAFLAAIVRARRQLDARSDR